jgi:hypothetical protein
MSPVPTRYEFLSAPDRDWVTRNGDILNATFAHYEAEGEWPERNEVIRPLRFAHPERLVTAAVDEMPAALGYCEPGSNRLVLTIFGLACCRRAAPLLDQYHAVSQLALSRFDVPSRPNRLSRAEVAEKLHLTPAEIDRLSRLLMSDAPFLGEGDSSIGGWDREIDCHVEELQGLDDVDALLSFLSRQRQITEEPQPPPAPEPTLSTPAPNHAPTAPPVTLAVAAALAGIGGFVFVLVRSPSVLSLTLLGIFIGLTLVLSLRRLWRRNLLVASLVGALAGGLLGAVAGALLQRTESHGPYRYFVASTPGTASVLIGRIEPHQDAPLQRETVLGIGDPAEVRCLQTEAGEIWAKLENGSFLEAARLSVEVGGDDAPIC